MATAELFTLEKGFYLGNCSDYLSPLHSLLLFSSNASFISTLSRTTVGSSLSTNDHIQVLFDFKHNLMFEHFTRQDINTFHEAQMDISIEIRID